MTNYIRQAATIMNVETQEKQLYFSINKAKKASRELKKSGHYVSKLVHKQTYKTSPSKQPALFIK